MKNEEKLKAFFNDKEKVKALANDEEFIDKVSKREATSETYKEEFKKFDIEISEDEAKQIQDTVNKIFETPNEKLLDDEFLEGVVGGGDSEYSPGIGTAWLIASGGTLVAAAGCAVAAFAYDKKGNYGASARCALAAVVLGMPTVLNVAFLTIEARREIGF